MKTLRRYAEGRSGPGAISATSTSSLDSTSAYIRMPAWPKTRCVLRLCAVWCTQQPHFRTFVTAGLAFPAPLRQAIEALGYTHDPTCLAPAAALVPDAFVDAVTLAGTIADVVSRVAHLRQLGMTHVLINPLAPDDDVERVIRDFAQEVMPRVN